MFKETKTKNDLNLVTCRFALSSNFEAANFFLSHSHAQRVIFPDLLSPIKSLPFQQHTFETFAGVEAF